MIDYSQVLKTHQFHKVQGSICGAVHVGIVVTKVTVGRRIIVPKSIPQVLKLAYTFDVFSGPSGDRTHLIEHRDRVTSTPCRPWAQVKKNESGEEIESSKQDGSCFPYFRVITPCLLVPYYALCARHIVKARPRRPFSFFGSTDGIRTRDLRGDNPTL